MLPHLGDNSREHGIHGNDLRAIDVLDRDAKELARRRTELFAGSRDVLARSRQLRLIASRARSGEGLRGCNIRFLLPFSD